MLKRSGTSHNVGVLHRTIGGFEGGQNLVDLAGEQWAYPTSPRVHRPCDPPKLVLGPQHPGHCEMKSIWLPGPTCQGKNVPLGSGYTRPLRRGLVYEGHAFNNLCHYNSDKARCDPTPLSRELQERGQVTRVSVFTGSRSDAGTDNNLYITLHGTHVVTGEKASDRLDCSRYDHNDLLQGEKDAYGFVSAVGDIDTITVELSGGLLDDWYAEWIVVEQRDAQDNVWTAYPFAVLNWVNSGESQALSPRRKCWVELMWWRCIGARRFSQCV